MESIFALQIFPKPQSTLLSKVWNDMAHHILQGVMHLRPWNFSFKRGCLGVGVFHWVGSGVTQTWTQWRTPFYNAAVAIPTTWIRHDNCVQIHEARDFCHVLSRKVAAVNLGNTEKLPRLVLQKFMSTCHPMKLLLEGYPRGSKALPLRVFGCFNRYFFPCRWHRRSSCEQTFIKSRRCFPCTEKAECFVSHS